MTLSAYPVSSLNHQNFGGEKHSLTVFYCGHTVDLNAIWKSYIISPENTLSSPLQDNCFTFLVSWNLQHLSPLPLNGQHDLILYEKIRSSQTQTSWPSTLNSAKLPGCVPHSLLPTPPAFAAAPASMGGLSLLHHRPFPPDCISPGIL